MRELRQEVPSREEAIRQDVVRQAREVYPMRKLPFLAIPAALAVAAPALGAATGALRV
jgi:hypothetical protein